MMKKVMVVSAMAMAAAMPQVVHASEWGCQVLLCLADPRGPTTEGACVPPIHKLWDELRKARPKFPTCDMAEGPGGKSWAQQGYGWYDPCPEGTMALKEGAHAMQGTKEMVDTWKATPTFKRAYVFSKVEMSTGIGEGNDVGFGYDDRIRSAKVCVGNLLGNVSKNVSDGYRTRSVSVGVYDRVVLMNPANSPRLINVFIDNKLARVVRW